MPAVEFAIMGAKRDTGEEVTVRIRAADEAAALAMASRQGILVESIATVSPAAPDPATGGSSRVIGDELIGAAPLSTAATCQNCGITIGKLESPRFWDEHLVCTDCFARLSRTGSQGPTPGLSSPNNSSAIPRPAGTRGGCPFCGSLTVGRVRGLQGFGEVLTFFILFLCLMIPGIAYYIYVESVPYCSGCGRRINR